MRVGPRRIRLGLLVAAALAALAGPGCVVAPARLTHELRPVTGHRYPDSPVGSLAFERAADFYTRTEAQSDNRIAFFPDPSESRAALDFLVERAERRICVEAALVGEGTLSQPGWEGLIDAARRGVAVRVILDGSRGGPDGERMVEDLVEAGGRVRWLNPAAATSLHLRLDNVSERRFAVVDGQYALMGMPPPKPDAARAGLFVAGSSASALEQAFAAMWEHAHRPSASRILPLSFVRSVGGFVRPARTLGRRVQKARRQLFTPPPYLIALLDDDRFEGAVAAARLGNPDARGLTPDDALAVVRWAATDTPPPPRPRPDDAAASEGGPAPAELAAGHGARLQDLADELLGTRIGPEGSSPPEGEAAARVAMLPPWSPSLAPGEGARLMAYVPDPPPPAPEPPKETAAAEDADGSRKGGAAGKAVSFAVDVTKNAVLPIVAMSTMNLALVVNPPALVAVNVAKDIVGMARERGRARRYVVEPSDTEPEETESVAAIAMPVVEASDGFIDPELERWARRVRERMGVSPAWAVVRMVPSRPDERTSAEFDLLMLGLHAAEQTVDLAGYAAKRTTRSLKSALKQAAARGVTVRRDPEKRAGAWMVVDDRLTTFGETRWNRRGFFMRYSLAVAVDDPSLAAAALRWMGQTAMPRAANPRASIWEAHPNAATPVLATVAATASCPVCSVCGGALWPRLEGDRPEWFEGLGVAMPSSSISTAGGVASSSGLPVPYADLGIVMPSP